MKPNYRTWTGKYLLISVAAIVIISALVLWGYSATWTGFGDFTKPDGELVRGKTLWDWMQLFIIPIFLSIGLFLLNRSERNSEREIATDRQHEMALQSYLDRMADLLLKEKLLTTESEEVHKVARIRTLTALRGLDGRRKGLILRFLYEADLIYNEKTVIDLAGADLQDTELQGVNLQNANLCFANLRGTNLQDAYLPKFCPNKWTGASTRIGLAKTDVMGFPVRVTKPKQETHHHERVYHSQRKCQSVFLGAYEPGRPGYPDA